MLGAFGLPASIQLSTFGTLGGVGRTSVSAARLRCLRNLAGGASAGETGEEAGEREHDDCGNGERGVRTGGVQDGGACESADSNSDTHRAVEDREAFGVVMRGQSLSQLVGSERG